jgi:hypothetical protein
LIEVFRREKNINTPLHIKDVNVKGDNIYKPPRQEIEDEINEMQSQKE